MGIHILSVLMRDRAMSLMKLKAYLPASFAAGVCQMWSRIDPSDLPNLDYKQELVTQRCGNLANSIPVAGNGNSSKNIRFPETSGTAKHSGGAWGLVP